jgi:sterol desaturase/sphingolipid hydroxylase (fatty acid hydroxylase superfamily)
MSMDAAVLSPAIVLIAALALIALERWRPYDRAQPFLREGFFNDFALYTIVQSYVLGYAIFAIAHFLDRITGLSSHGILSGWSVPAQLGLSLVVHDFYIYWFHRLQHTNRYLWRLHEAHHSTHEVDWLSGSRSHSLEILINQTVEFAPLVLLGCAPETIAFKSAIDAIWGMYIHSNLDVRTGWLQRVVNGPEMHRWHHAIDDDAHNRNFSTKLAIWDWLFGTAFRPAGRRPSGYGLGDPAFPRNYIRQHLYAFRRFEQQQGESSSG